jgi:hypothetical protein
LDFITAQLSHVADEKITTSHGASARGKSSRWICRGTSPAARTGSGWACERSRHAMTTATTTSSAARIRRAITARERPVRG